MTCQLIILKIAHLRTINNYVGFLLYKKLLSSIRDVSVRDLLVRDLSVRDLSSVVSLVPVLGAFSLFSPQLAASYEVSNEVTAQWRGFVHEGDMGQQRSHVSLEYQGEFFYEADSGNDFLIIEPKLRVDQHDPERNLVDLQKAYWNHLGDGWELRAGIHKVFWGVTESRHLVDVINQTDAVSALDQEDKLGQPMLNASIEFDSGILDLFMLVGHRERTFPGEDGRFRTFIPVDTDEAHYESSKEERRIDWAVRWVQTLDDTDIGVYAFSGTSREPLLTFNNDLADPKLEPYYPVITQLGLDIQHVYESWLLKLEAIYRNGFDNPTGSGIEFDEHYEAMVAGFEYTQVGIFDSAMDLGWIGEYLYDSRGKDDPLAMFEDDWFVGWRLAFNDIDDSELLAGLIIDPSSSEKTFGMEYSQRLSDSVSLAIEGRTWFGGDKAPDSLQMALMELQAGQQRDKLASLMNDDYVELNLTYYF